MLTRLSPLVCVCNDVCVYCSCTPQVYSESEAVVSNDAVDSPRPHLEVLWTTLIVSIAFVRKQLWGFILNYWFHEFYLCRVNVGHIPIRIEPISRTLAVAHKSLQPCKIPLLAIEINIAHSLPITLEKKKMC